jgi:hypothetical protein
VNKDAEVGTREVQEEGVKEGGIRGRSGRTGTKVRKSEWRKGKG